LKAPRRLQGWCFRPAGHICGLGKPVARAGDAPQRVDKIRSETFR